MCYYARTDYRCGDWRWGNMKLRCPRQHRMGETCGAKLVHIESVTTSPELCKICQEIAIKERRLKKEQDNVERWSKDGTKFSASIEKAQRESQQLAETIQQLQNRRPWVMMQNRQGTGQPGPDLGFSVRPAARGASAASQGSYTPTTTTSHSNNQGQYDRHAPAGHASASGMNAHAYRPDYGGTSSSHGYSAPNRYPYSGQH